MDDRMSVQTMDNTQLVAELNYADNIRGGETYYRDIVAEMARRLTEKEKRRESVARYYAQATDTHRLFLSRHTKTWQLFDRDGLADSQGEIVPVAMFVSRKTAFAARDALCDMELARDELRQCATELEEAAKLLLHNKPLPAVASLYEAAAQRVRKFLGTA